jgi:hypothetical protein
MIKIKLLAGLVAGLAIMAMSAAPAGAWFKSLNGTPQGQAKIIGTTELIAGGAKVSCESASGEWHIQTKGQWWEHNQNGKQEPTTEGPHLYIKISKWNTCKATVALEKVKSVTVSACEFQLEQPNKGETKATGTVVSTCTIKVPLTKECVITIPPGSKKQTEPINELLGKTEAENSGKNLLGTAEVGGIHGTGTCLEGEFVKGEFKSLPKELVGEELNLS